MAGGGGVLKDGSLSSRRDNIEARIFASQFINSERDEDEILIFGVRILG